MATRTPPNVSVGNKVASTMTPATPTTPTNTSGANHSGSTMNVPQERIAMRAYEKWCQRGCQHGTHEQDWHEAEQELRSEMSRAARQPSR